jgi:hypothetical protein
MNKTTTSIIILALVIAGAIYFSSPKNNNVVIVPDVTTSTATSTVIDNTPNTNTSSNVTVEKGVQIISIVARDGYSPENTIAKAGVPTIIRFITYNAFDCSRSVRLDGVNISKILPQTGTTDINIGTQSAGLFRGTCGMGMYVFEIDFK